MLWTVITCRPRVQNFSEVLSCMLGFCYDVYRFKWNKVRPQENAYFLVVLIYIIVPKTTSYFEFWVTIYLNTVFFK